MESDRRSAPQGGKSGSRPASSRDEDRLRKQRLLQLIEMAQSYSGWTKSQLAAALNRDPAKVAPDSGNPKLDLVVRLADILDWTIGDVAEALWLDPVKHKPDEEPLPDKSYHELNCEAVNAYRMRDHRRMLQAGRFMWRLAQTPSERGKAANRIAGAYLSAGLIEKGMRWWRVAVMEPGLPRSMRLTYLANLAQANFAMGNLDEAAGLASEVQNALAQLKSDDDSTLFVARAMAGYVGGNARRRLMQLLPERRDEFGPRALADLRQSVDDYRRLGQEGRESCNAHANSCDGAIIEVEVLLGLMPVKEATDRLLAGLDAVVVPSSLSQGDWLESWGWWAVYGLDLALDRLSGDEQESLAAIFSNKAHEIADRIDDWQIRERAFSLEHHLKLHHGCLCTAGHAPWIIDREDLKVVLGTMGRFPWFRDTGWEILESAEFI